MRAARLLERLRPPSASSAPKLRVRKAIIVNTLRDIQVPFIV